MDKLTQQLREAAEGDARALESFVAGSQADVWRFCASIVGTANADDAVQETYLRAWRAARTFRGDSSAKTWLLTIARRVSYAAARKQAVQQERQHTAAAAGTSVAVSAGKGGRDKGAGDHAEEQALNDLIAGLEPDRRSAFVLTQLVGLGYEEAAVVCGCPVGTIRSRVARARADLAAAHAGAGNKERRMATPEAEAKAAGASASPD